MPLPLPKYRWPKYRVEVLPFPYPVSAGPSLKGCLLLGPHWLLDWAGAVGQEGGWLGLSCDHGESGPGIPWDHGHGGLRAGGAQPHICRARTHPLFGLPRDFARFLDFSLGFDWGREVASRVGLGPLASLSRVWVSPGGVRSHAVCSSTPPAPPPRSHAGPSTEEGVQGVPVE